MKKDFQYFNVSQSSSIYIYGAGHLGTSVCNKLLSANYNVVGILDQNRNLEKKPVKLYYPGEEPYLDDACIFICLYNGLQHTSVARNLQKRGYNKILFLPLFLNTRSSKRMIYIYNCLMAGYLDIMTCIPLYNELWKLRLEDYFLRETKKYVTVMIPSNHVYTGKQKKIDGFDAFEDCSPENIITPPNSDFKFDSPFDESMSYMFEQLLKRFDLHSFFKNALFDGLDYFIDAAPPARLKSNGKFNLLDGHHRTCFLFNNKFQGIPLQILKTEYEQYFNQKAANTLMEYCKELDELPLNIYHPAFVRFPVNNNLFDENFNVLFNALKYSEDIE
jgi:hypothetical protein